VLRAIAVAVVGLLGAAPVGGAPAEPVATLHTTLDASSPAPGDTLALPPELLRLEFGGPVEATGAVLTLLGAAGHSWTLEAVRAPDDVRLVTALLPPLASGGYRLEWRVVSADGHPVAGDFVFFVGERGAVFDAPPAPRREGGDAAGAGHQAEPAEAPISMVVTRVGANFALLALAGLLFFSAWGGAEAGPRTATVARALAAAAPVLTVVYAWMWSGGVLGEGTGVEARLQGLLDLTSGRGLAAEAVLTALAAWALLLARRPAMAAGFALLAVAAGALAGHAAAYSPAVTIPATALHLLASALWLGGLVFLLTERRSAGYARSAHKVSDVALGAVVAIALTGLLQTWLLLGTIPWPTGSTYARLLLAKIVGFAGLIAFGAYHRFRLLPIMSAGGDGRLGRSVRNELLLALGVVAVAAVLSHVPPTP
jgi:copper transport protein